MTVKEVVDRRMGFPITRKLILAGAIMANAASAAYLQSHEPAEEVVENDDYQVGMYLQGGKMKRIIDTRLTADVIQVLAS